jgi:hypothetical protein
METNTDKQIKALKEKLIVGQIFSHPNLDVICMGGSNSSNSAGRLSDIDITTLMKPDNPNKIDTSSILQLGSQLRNFAFEESNGHVVVVIISTIRLEEAQISIAELLNPGKLIVPIHWLHYPSVEFAAINEPPELVEGLLSGKNLKGNTIDAIKRLRNVDRSRFGSLAGLDWLTDSFRVFISNLNGGEFIVQRQSDSFLKKLSLHNLEYFWKWNIIRKIIENKTGQKPSDWKAMDQFSNFVPNEIWDTAGKVRLLRHKGDWADTAEIINLHSRTFEFILPNT